MEGCYFGWIPRDTRLGLLLDVARKRVNTDEEAVLLVNRVVHTSLNPNDLNALGCDYLKTKGGKKNSEIIDKYYKEIEKRKIRK